MLKCLNMLKENGNLVDDCDEQRKTPLHWACQKNLGNMVRILVDFGAPMHAKDDFSRKPHDEAVTYAQSVNSKVTKEIQDLFDKDARGTLDQWRSISQYDQPLYVKYLTPVERVKELAEFISRVRDMSTLNKPRRDKSREGNDGESDDSEDIGD